MNFAARSYSRLFAPSGTLRFVVDPDTECRCSGEGYVLLQRIVEERTGKGLNELPGDRVFEPMG